jgi:geranylgeranyl reductase family protein
MHVSTHDVVIVGAGPAGSAAAAALSRRGRDVLLLDRAEFPRDKPCGDGVPPGTVGILNGLGLRDELRAAGFSPVRAIRLVSARGRDFRLDLRPRRGDETFYIAPRLRLDDLLRRHALACGARFERARVRAPLIEGGRVAGVLVDGEGAERIIRARHVIGADGATSVLARALDRNRQPSRDRGVALRAYVQGIETHPATIELHFRSSLAPGYAWIFPLGETRANVGVMVRTDRFQRRGVSLVQLLDEFLSAREVRRRLSAAASVHDVATWQLPYATPRAGRRALAGALLIGDAGRFVDALTGEGIHNAVLSATIAAEVIDEALTHPERGAQILASFDARCRRSLGGLVARSHRAQRRVAAHPVLLEACFIGARAGRGLVTSWLNRVSTDFLVRQTGLE